MPHVHDDSLLYHFTQRETKSEHKKPNKLEIKLTKSKYACYHVKSHPCKKSSLFTLQSDNYLSSHTQPSFLMSNLKEEMVKEKVLPYIRNKSDWYTK